VKVNDVAPLLAGMALLLSPIAVCAATFYIDTPDLCSSLERTEGNRVYLVSKGGCPKTPGKVKVTAGERTEKLEVYVNGSFWKKQALTRFDIDSIGDVNDRGDKLSKTLTIPVNPFAEEGAERAKATNDFFRSGEFQRRISAEQERLKREIFGGRIQEYYQGDPQVAATMAGELPANERIYIFISSSMPRETLRNYVRDVARLRDPNVKLVMRGLIGGVKYIKPTMRFVSGILLKDPACDPEKNRCERFAAGVNVDPLLFGRYGIKEVPAIVYARNVTVLDAEMSEGMERNMKSGDYYTIHGDVALAYALERFRAETGSKALETLIRKLNAGFYGEKGIRQKPHKR
jgi:type-F conjugative transfer system pilin assembly protein TrbC